MPQKTSAPDVVIEAPAAAPPPVDLTDPSLYINRELSWLAFNQRVLDQANDLAHPLLERVKFLAIVADNLDEFYMVRVATLLKKFRAGVDGTSPDGLNTEQQLHAIRQRAAQMLDDVATCWQELLRPLLESEAIRFLEPADYTRRGEDVSGGLLQDAHLARPDAAGLRSRPPVSLHLESEPQLRRRRASQRAHEVRPREGARQAAAIRGDSRAQERARFGRPPDAHLRVHRGRHPAEHPGAVPGHPGQERAPVPHRPRHRHGDPGRRGRRPARKRRPQPAPAALRRAVAAAGRSQHAAAGARHPRRELRGRRRRRPAHVRPAGVCRLHGADRAAPAGAEGRAVCAAPSVGRARQRGDLRRDPVSGLPGPQPVRVVCLGGVVPARGGEGPARASRSR